MGAAYGDHRFLNEFIIGLEVVAWRKFNKILIKRNRDQYGHVIFIFTTNSDVWEFCKELLYVHSKSSYMNALVLFIEY